MKITRKWTEGPWEVDGSQIIKRAKDDPESYIPIADYIDNEADAKLIAAAPDLAEALAEAYTTLADTGCTDHDGWSPCGDCDNCKSLRACYDALRKAGALEEESGEG